MPIYRFGNFQFDPHAGRLIKGNSKLRVQRKPRQLLMELLKHPGETVTRKELQTSLWPDEAHRDFETGLNVAVKKLRDALCDSAEEPVYVATVVGIGYCFIAAVEKSNIGRNGGPVKVTSDWNAERPDRLDVDRVPTPDIVPASLQALDYPNGNITTTTNENSRDHIGESGQALRIFQLFKKRYMSALAIAVLAVLIVLTPNALRSWFPVVAKAEPIRAVITPAAGTRLVTTGDYGGLAVSPDGTRVVFSAIGPNGRTLLYIRRMDALTPVVISGSEGGSFPFWSPDGSEIGFFTDAKLKRLVLATGKITNVCAAHSGRGGTWSSNGTILFASETRSPIYAVPAAGGVPLAVTRLESTGSSTHRWPGFLADNDHFVFFAASHNAASASGTIYLQSLTHNSPIRLTGADSNAQAVGSALLFVTGGKLLSQSLDVGRATLGPQATVLAANVDYDRGLWYANFAASASSLVYHTRSDPDRGQVIALFDEQGNRIRDISHPGAFFSVNLAPDGRTIASGCGDPNRNICLVHLDGTVTQVTNSPLSSAAIWSPDSTAIAYDRHHDPSHFRLLLKWLIGNVPEQEIFGSSEGLHPLSWHPDGKHMLVGTNETGACCVLRVLDLSTRRLSPYLPSKSATLVARFSPDGRWVAYQSDDTGTSEIYISSYPVPRTRYRLTKSGGASPRWSRDGHMLYFLAPGQVITSVEISSNGTALIFGEPHPLFSPPLLAPPFDRDSFDVDATGHHFVVNTVGVGDSSPLVLVSKWE
jgi:eukaryotic-like serine/threonine-protein kinase